MNITDEMVEAATRAIHDMDCDTGVCTGQFSIEGRYGRWARAAVEAAAPLIAAHALREAAKSLDDAAAGAVERARRDSHDGSGASAYAGGLYAAAAKLGVRADSMLAEECGEPYRVVIPDSP